MSPLWKNRVAGAWVDSEAVGAVRAGGLWVPFGPSGGPAYEALDWPNEPTLVDGDDGTTYVMGGVFHLLVSKDCYGVQWKVPTNTPNPPGGTHAVAVWDLTPTRLAYKEFVPVPGGYQDILFDTPITLSASPTQYVASVLTRHYSYSDPTPGTGWLVESPSGNIRHDDSRLSTTTDPTTFPGGSFDSWYYVSPLVGV